MKRIEEIRVHCVRESPDRGGYVRLHYYVLVDGGMQRKFELDEIVSPDDFGRFFDEMWERVGRLFLVTIRKETSESPNSVDRKEKVP